MKNIVQVVLLASALIVGGGVWQPVSAQTKVADFTVGGASGETSAGAVPTADGGLLIGSSTFSAISGEVTQPYYGSTANGDYWVVKLDAQGNKLWDKRFGGLGDDRMIKILPAATGGFLLCGWSTSDAGYDKSEPSQGGYDYWVVKIDEQGNKLWDKRYGSAGGDMLMTAVATPDGGCLLTGYSGGTDASSNPASGDRTEAVLGYTDVWLVKLNALGAKQWDKRLGGPGAEYVYDAACTPDGGYVIGALPFVDGGGGGTAPGGDVSEASKGGADYWVVKLDAAGTKQWNHLYGGTGYDYLNALLVTPDGSIVVGGQSNSPVSGDKTVSATGKSIWLLKLTATGVKQWDQVYGSGNYDYLRTLQLAANGDYLLGGNTALGLGLANTRDPADYLAIRVVPTGQQRWQATVGGEGDEALTTLILDYAGSVLLVGVSDSNTGRDKTANSRGEKDNWLVKLNSPTPLATQAPLASALTTTIYPNPGRELVMVACTGLQAQGVAKIELLTSLGQVAWQQTAPVQQGRLQQTVSLAALASGFYTVRVQVAEGVIVRKLVKE